jgi:hypothetical protein
LLGLLIFISESYHIFAIYIHIYKTRERKNKRATLITQIIKNTCGFSYLFATPKKLKIRKKKKNGKYGLGRRLFALLRGILAVNCKQRT